MTAVADPTSWSWFISAVIHVVALALAMRVGIETQLPPELATLTARLVPREPVMLVTMPPQVPKQPTECLRSATSGKPKERLAHVPTPTMPVIASASPAPAWGLLLPIGPGLVVLPEQPADTGAATPPTKTLEKTPDAGSGAAPAETAGTGSGTSPVATLGTGSGTSQKATGGAGGDNGATNSMAEIRAPLTRPSYARTPLPDYPRAARNSGWEGVVLLHVEVMGDGRVGRVELARSSGHDTLDQSAIKAVRNWRFHPAKHGDAPIACFIDIPVRFKLDSTGM